MRAKIPLFLITILAVAALVIAVTGCSLVPGEKTAGAACNKIYTGSKPSGPLRDEKICIAVINGQAQAVGEVDRQSGKWVEDED
jgi:hypothetical protein